MDPITESDRMKEERKFGNSNEGRGDDHKLCAIRRSYLLSIILLVSLPAKRIPLSAKFGNSEDKREFQFSLSFSLSLSSLHFLLLT